MFFFQAEDGIRDLVRSRGLGDVYKRQVIDVGCGSGILSIAALKLGATKVLGVDIDIESVKNLSLIHI